MVRITEVEKGSRAERAGIIAGDILTAINKNEINDVLDYRFYLTESDVTIDLLRGESAYSVTLRKGQYEDIGLGFETPLMDKKHTCKNKCIFCFIDQNPEGLRDSLYFKDDDSRLSFLHGNYITLTNMTDADIARIVKMRFSPINVSVHTTNPELRVKMMKNKHAGDVLRYLRTLYDAGISMCAQIVLCRGINDGDELLRSICDLSEYYPALTSIAVVPAGLTKYRDGLYPLTDFTPSEAAGVIDAIDSFAAGFLSEHGTRLVYPADEFYLKAGRPIPSAEYYGDYPQLENGVGMLRSFADEFSMSAEDLRDGIVSYTPRTVSLVTGVAAYNTVTSLCNKLTALCPGLNIKVYKIINKFFGESITVTGLLTGKDICEQLEGADLGDELLIPQNALRFGEEVFLCNMTVSEMSARLGVKVRPTGSDGYELAESILNPS